MTYEEASSLEAMIAYIQEQIKQREPASLGRPASDETIDLVEQAIGVALPEDYKWFLRTYGSLYWPDQVLGTLGDFNYPGNVVRETQNERAEVYPAIPHHLIPIYNDGWGNHDCLNTAQIELGICPVVFWNHELDEDQIPDLTKPSFTEWLAWMVAERIKMESED